MIPNLIIKLLKNWVSKRKSKGFWKPPLSGGFAVFRNKFYMEDSNTVRSDLEKKEDIASDIKLETTTEDNE